MGLMDNLRSFAKKKSAPPPEPPKKRTSPNHPALRWKPEPAPSVCIVGERHHVSEIAKAVGKRRERGYLQAVDVTLVRDAGNQHDGNAIRAEVNGHIVGYIAREVAADLAPQMDAAGVKQCLVPGIVRDGTSDASPRGSREHEFQLWLDRVKVPSGLSLSSSAARRATWPPRAWEGQLPCPQCGGFAWARENPGRQLSCDRCGEQWPMK